MDDEERLEGEEEMELDETSDAEDEDEDNSGIPISPANSDQMLGPRPTSGNGQSKLIKSIFLNVTNIFSNNLFKFVYFSHTRRGLSRSIKIS